MTSRNPKALSVGFLFDDTLDSTAGVAQYVKTLGAWLSKQGHHVFYMVGETKSRQWAGGRVYSLAKNVGVSFNANRLSTPLPTASSSDLKKIISREKPDIIHVQVPYSPFMAQRVINRLNPETAVIGTFCILPVGRATSWGLRALRPIYGRSLKRIDTMLAVSQAAADFAQVSLGRSSTILPNAIDCSIFKPTSKPKRPGNKVVFLGRLVDRKGAFYLLRAFRKLSKRLPGSQLVLAGAGPQLNSLKQYVERHKLNSAVSFPGFIPEKRKAELLASADIACFPSLYGESFGISLIEAMAAGSGVVLGGDNPGYRSVLGAQPLMLGDPTKSSQFAKRLERLLTDDKLVGRLHDWQTEAVKQYDINVVGPQLLGIYRRSIAKRQTNR